jgi:acyltransferase
MSKPSPAIVTGEPVLVGPGRIAGLDAARALAVLAMVFGHTLDATLSPAARATEAMTLYWKFRAFTAPLFLFVSGCALMWVLTHKRWSSERATRRFLPKVLWLLFLGYSVRFPLWDIPGWLRGELSVWKPFLTFDALQCIGTSIAVLLAVCAGVKRDWQRMVVLFALALLCVVSAESIWAFWANPDSNMVWAQTLGGGSSRFSIFPWSAYFLVGAAFGIALARWPRMAFGFLLGAMTIFLVLDVWGRNTLFLNIQSLPDWAPRKVIWRAGPVLALLLLAFALPSRVSQSLGPVGRSSLWAYVLHLPLCYGWGHWHGLATHVGRTLSAAQACALGVGMVLFTALTAPLLRRLYASIPWRALPRRLARLKGQALPSPLPRTKTLS